MRSAPLDPAAQQDECSHERSPRSVATQWLKRRVRPQILHFRKEGLAEGFKEEYGPFKSHALRPQATEQGQEGGQALRCPNGPLGHVTDFKISGSP